MQSRSTTHYGLTTHYTLLTTHLVDAVALGGLQQLELLKLRRGGRRLGEGVDLHMVHLGPGVATAGLGLGSGLEAQGAPR